MLCMQRTHLQLNLLEVLIVTHSCWFGQQIHITMSQDLNLHLPRVPCIGCCIVKGWRCLMIPYQIDLVLIDEARSFDLVGWRGRERRPRVVVDVVLPAILHWIILSYVKISSPNNLAKSRQWLKHSGRTNASNLVSNKIKIGSSRRAKANKTTGFPVKIGQNRSK